jgi:hypothetical protein
MAGHLGGRPLPENDNRSENVNAWAAASSAGGGGHSFGEARVGLGSGQTVAMTQ